MTEHLWHAAAVPFEAARHVTILPADHPARRLHGHSFVARVRAELPRGWATFDGAEVDDLRARLGSCVAPLDYRLLNEIVECPTDENLARWVRNHVGVPGVRSIGIQSTADQGVDLDADDHAHIWRRYRFESAHRLPHVPPGHKCGRMHGHGFEVIVHADQDLGARAMGVDFARLDALWAPLHAELDHACLNDIPGLENPTSETISSWLWARLAPDLPELSWITVYETASCGAHFDGESYRIWKEMTLDSAVRLDRAPPGDPRRRVHGHTFTLRLHLHAPLDRVLGWTIDFGDVKACFDPVFRLLDHHPLHELAGAHGSDCTSLARWIRTRAEPVLPQLDRVDLYETRGCGAILGWAGDGPALPV
ncbi:MAG: 6-pyruvoyl tetrahydropterin synthase [Betaproteobacteria bacterium]|nr:6-pyruvoyl tetrahydropterin synthase [Betaproteobacteria bacterium]